MNCRTFREILHSLCPVVANHGSVLADHIVSPVHEQIREPPLLVCLETDSLLFSPIVNSQLHIDPSTPSTKSQSFRPNTQQPTTFHDNITTHNSKHVRRHSSRYALAYEHPLPALQTHQVLLLLSNNQFTTSYRLFDTLYKTSNLSTQHITTTNNNNQQQQHYHSQQPACPAPLLVLHAHVLSALHSPTTLPCSQIA